MLTVLPRILIATSNPGKLRDFAGMGAAGIELAALPGIESLPPVPEEGATFAANAITKAESYSRYAPGQLLLADDSGLQVAALAGAPGVHSARYAAGLPRPAGVSLDQANNARLLRELESVPAARRQAKFVCVLAAARDGATLATFRGEVRGVILTAPRGAHGFGYDPLFFIPELGKTTAEMLPAEKAGISHRGRAFQKFAAWLAANPPA